MKILISSGYFNKTPYSDNNIAISLAQSFQKRGCKCDIVGMTYDIEEDQVLINGIRVYKIPYAKAIIMHARKAMKQELFLNEKAGINTRQKLRFLFRHPIFSAVMKMNKHPKFREYLISDYAREVTKLINHNGYDVLISTVFSFEQTEFLFHSKKITAVRVYYQLDPFGLFELKPENKRTYDIKREVETMQQADYIFTTRELFQQYGDNPVYIPMIHKMEPIGFPTFIIPLIDNEDSRTIRFDPGKINILYSGTVDDNNRNPIAILKIFKQLMEFDDRIKLYFLGYFESAQGKQFIEANLPTTVILPPVSGEEALQAMSDADILLNIGNTILNMVPSKIFTYFALGKPIINVEKVLNDPSARYFAKYPLSYTVKENSAENNIDNLYLFIKNNAKKKADFWAMEAIYHENTPDYVADRMFDVVNNMVKH